MPITVDHDQKKIKLDSVSLFVATYLSWVNQFNSYATFWPLISYRGHCKTDWRLIPSLCRQALPIPILKQMEGEVIQQFRDRFELSDWTPTEILAYARHHGAPTRLLDWSRNPFVGLWFAISDKSHDDSDAVVYQLCVPASSTIMIIGDGFNLEHAESDKNKHPIHIFTSPARIDRTNRQRSVFSVATFKDDYVIKPLDEVVNQENKQAIRKFLVPATTKPALRRLLSNLALDAYSIYGDPDSFGKAISVQFDISDLKFDSKLPELPASAELYPQGSQHEKSH